MEFKKRSTLYVDVEVVICLGAHLTSISVEGEDEEELRKFKLMLLMSKIVLQLIGSLSSCESQGFQTLLFCAHYFWHPLYYTSKATSLVAISPITS